MPRLSLSAKIACLAKHHGQHIKQLSELPDFKSFRLLPQGSHFVKGFAKAYKLTSGFEPENRGRKLAA